MAALFVPHVKSLETVLSLGGYYGRVVNYFRVLRHAEPSHDSNSVRYAEEFFRRYSQTR